MKNSLINPSKFAKHFFPNYLIWNFPNEVNSVFLTFDDGPTEELTVKILNILGEKKIKATFFIVGENIEKKPELYKQIINSGHEVGNHTHNHLKGWKSETISYFRNVLKASKQIDSALFRPPYGKITLRQAKYLKNRFDIIMWSVLTYDFDKTVSPEECLLLSMEVKPGNIVVFHDNVKSADNLLYALPRFIDFCLSKGYVFKTISEGLNKKEEVLF